MYVPVGLLMYVPVGLLMYVPVGLLMYVYTCRFVNVCTCRFLTRLLMFLKETCGKYVYFIVYTNMYLYVLYVYTCIYMSKVFIKVMLELQTYSGPASNNYGVLLRLVLSLLCLPQAITYLQSAARLKGSDTIDEADVLEIAGVSTVPISSLMYIHDCTFH